jgi:hypothetical protein
MFGKMRHRKVTGGEPSPAVDEEGAKLGTTGAIDSPGEAVSLEAANRRINSAEHSITLAAQDVAFADGKMDTSRVAHRLGNAADLLAMSKDAFARGSYAQADAYAEAATNIAELAGMLIAQALGNEKLPSQGPPDDLTAPPAGQAASLPDREQVRRELLKTHDELVLRDSLPIHAQVDAYLTEAITAYKVAHDAYVDGSYQAAGDQNRVAQSMLRIAESIVNAIKAGSESAGGPPPAARFNEF